MRISPFFGHRTPLDIYASKTASKKFPFLGGLTTVSYTHLFNFSTKYLSSLVKNETGKSFSTYLTDLRLDRAIDLLLHTDLGIKEIAASVGYSDPRYFHRLFKKHVGKTPSQYRK